MKRRTLLLGGAAVAVAGAGAYLYSRPAIIGRSFAAGAGGDLLIPDVIEPGNGAKGELDAITSSSSFLDGIKTRTMGYGQSYLGPVVRVKRGQTASMVVSNKTDAAITAHWHGLHTEGRNDGGPQTAFQPGEKWSPELEIDQPAATLWYHSHVHGETGPQVYAGLAGMMIIDDPDAQPSGLPETYGIDDIPLIIQDRAFDEDGQLLYFSRGPAMMHGFRGGDILVNGGIRPKANVPAGLVRFRLLNGSNSRIYTFSFEDGRKFHQVGTDGGLLPAPIEKTSIVVAPAERVEIVVDFSNGNSTRLLSLPDFNDPMAGGMMGMGGMMGRMMGGNVSSPEALDEDENFEIMSFAVDKNHKAKVQSLPSKIAGAPLEPQWGDPVKRRSFVLEMGMGGMMRGGNRNNFMSINGKSMEMDRIDVEARLGETEFWHVQSTGIAHPFHIHGTSFKVLSHNGEALPYGQTGLKDVFLIRGEAEILVNFRKKASRETPFMYHCHILEHEDAGMMGQFTVR
ncbi:MAG: multicopper oxidase domain-containing protein [Rhizobiaceae bacterium]